MNSIHIGRHSLLSYPIVEKKVVEAAIGVSFFLIATSLGAYVRIPLPFTPVPITAQTFFVLLGVLVLGSRLGGFTQLLYLLSGAIGLNVFAGGASGFAHILGPTGGYLVSYVLFSFIVGWALKPKRSVLRVAPVVFGGSLFILLFGTFWLGFVLQVNLSTAFRLGFLPFLPGDLIKSLLVLLAYSGYRRWRNL